MMSHGPFWGGSGLWEFVIGSLWVAFWILVALIVIRIFRRLGGRPQSSALRVLEERYARGEIERDEFLERRDVLTRSGG